MTCPSRKVLQAALMAAAFEPAVAPFTKDMNASPEVANLPSAQKTCLSSARVQRLHEQKGGIFQHSKLCPSSEHWRVGLTACNVEGSKKQSCEP